MADKLSITIALQGGKEIQNQLADIGAAGQKAFDDIVNAAEKAGGLKQLKPEEVTQKLKNMGIVGEDALNKIAKAVASATRLESLVGVVVKLESGFAALRAALPPVAAGAVAIGIAMVKMASDAVTAINKIDSAAIKAGLSIEKFSQLKDGLEQAGISAKAVADGISAIGAAAERANIEQVAKDFKTLQEAAARGFGGKGTEEWDRLSQAAAGVGKAAEDARKAIVELGGTLSDNMPKSLGEMIAATGSAEAGLKAFVTQLVGMNDAATRNALALRDLSASFGTELVQGINNGTISLKNGGASIDALIAKYPSLTQANADAANAIEQSFNKLGASWERLKTTIGGQLISTDLLKDISAALDGINSLLKPETWTSWGTAAVQAVTSVLAAYGKLLVAIAQTKLPTGAGGQTFETGAAPGFAGGGLLGGIGSGTSDSNLAWVSRGEHIMPAAVVRQPGVLALLEGLRRGGGFAMGGVMPRFAEGGLVGGMGHLGTVDLRTDHGSVTLMASGSAVDQLSRLAVTKRITSTGRKPGFIG